MQAEEPLARREVSGAQGTVTQKSPLEHTQMPAWTGGPRKAMSRASTRQGHGGEPFGGHMEGSPAKAWGSRGI